MIDLKDIKIFLLTSVTTVLGITEWLNPLLQFIVYVLTILYIGAKIYKLRKKNN